jgi:hypothetical protein
MFAKTRKESERRDLRIEGKTRYSSMPKSSSKGRRREAFNLTSGNVHAQLAPLPTREAYEFRSSRVVGQMVVVLVLENAAQPVGRRTT